MSIKHLAGSIDGLLKYRNKKLGQMFEMDGAEVRRDLKASKKRGELLIPSIDCDVDKFDSKTGCECK